MSTQIEIPAGEPTIVMTRVYDAPRALVWTVSTRPEHVRQWWGGPGFTNPVCEMDLRPGGLCAIGGKALQEVLERAGG